MSQRFSMEFGNRRFGTGRYVSAVVLTNVPSTEKAQADILELLQAAADELGPVSQFTVSAQGDIRVQLKFNWTQEPRVDVNYEPHKRLIVLLDGQTVCERVIRVDATEHAYKSTNEGRPLSLGPLIRALRETEASNRERVKSEALARARQAVPDCKVALAPGGVALTRTREVAVEDERVLVTLDCATQTPKTKTVAKMSEIAGLPEGHWLYRWCSWRCPACADEVGKVVAAFALDCGHVVCDTCFKLLQREEYGGIEARREGASAGVKVSAQITCPRCTRASATDGRGPLAF